MAIIALGAINKKLIYPLIYLIIFSLLYVYWSDEESNIVILAIESFGTSIGQIFTVFVNIKYRYNLKKNNPIKHKYFKDFFIQFLISVLFLASNLFEANIEKEGKEGEEGEKTNYVNRFYFNDALVIIFITIITHFILKDKYYIHHIISIIAIVILSTSIDIILGNFFNTRIFIVIGSIIYVFADSLLFSYYKYLIEFKYYYFLDPLLAEGIIHFFLTLLSFFGILLIQNLNDSKTTIISEFSDYYYKFGISNILLHFFVSLIFKGFFIGLLDFLILNELTPNFVIIAFELSRIPSSIIKQKDSYRWYILIISIIQVIFLLFYLEIIEYNFCSLNKNTKKNISERELKLKEEINNLDNDNNDDQLTIEGYDIADGLKNEIKALTELGEEITEDNTN